jgi:hypothetical protein
MISPFVVPGQTAYRFQGVLCLTHPDDGWMRREHLVAVPLSPCESLLVPLAHFRLLTHRHAQCAYSRCDGERPGGTPTSLLP